MKKLIYGMAAVAISTVFANCSNQEVIPMTQEELVKADYEAKFIQKFGKPSPDQTWGFGKSSTKSVASIGTRWAYTNGNEWAKDWTVIQPLTAAQKDKVRRYFQTHKTPQNTPVNYTNFWVQDVYKGGTNTEGSMSTEKYTPAIGGEFIGSDKMNKLTAGSNDDHINNYNGGQCSENTTIWDGSLRDPSNQNTKIFHTDKLMLMINSKTDCFGFSNSLQSGNQYNKNYVIVPGDVIMQWESATTAANGENSDVSGMYFVGFDYDANFANGIYNMTNTNTYMVTEVSENTPGAFHIPNTSDQRWYIAGAADGYYSDWIVRVCEATPKPDYRIIAEDLSVADASDFDFNDVVFDVKMNYPNNGVHTIILQAAGGTLPLKVGESEVHRLFGVSTTTMVNTGAGVSKAPVTFKYAKNITNVNEIPVKVQKNGQWIELVAPVGKVASKICVQPKYVWCDEREDIDTRYPNFSPWIRGEHDGLWY